VNGEYSTRWDDPDQTGPKEKKTAAGSFLSTMAMKKKKNAPSVYDKKRNGTRGPYSENSNLSQRKNRKKKANGPRRGPHEEGEKFEKTGQPPGKRVE